jgi:hypothetical protein
MWTIINHKISKEDIVKWLVACFLCFIICSVTRAGVTTLEGINPGGHSLGKPSPQYLLILRYWSISDYCQTSNPVKCFGPDWVYLNETYQTLDEVLNRLNTYTGQGVRDKTNVVGLWKLGDDKNIIDTALQLDATEHEKARVVEKDRWTEYKWRKQ